MITLRFGERKVIRMRCICIASREDVRIFSAISHTQKAWCCVFKLEIFVFKHATIYRHCPFAVLAHKVTTLYKVRHDKQKSKGKRVFRISTVIGRVDVKEAII